MKCTAAARISQAGRSEKNTQRVLGQWSVGTTDRYRLPGTGCLGWAREAAAAQELPLLARVCWFTYFSREVCVPGMDRSDFSEVLLLSAPAPPVRKSLRWARPFSSFDPNSVACVDATGAALAGSVVLNACKQGLNRR